jgi:anaerobic selenocysteine-containing dehydrogenase
MTGTSASTSRPRCSSATSPGSSPSCCSSPRARNGELLLVGRRDLRSNNSWMHNSQRLVKGPDRCTLLMHPDDARSRGLSAGQTVEVTSRVGKVPGPPRAHRLR